MISARDNLLIRPWQQRKYENHKRKVNSAAPVIDTKSPPFRAHVAVKLKKLQRENERTQKIERDNLILLQKLKHIMTTQWVDNWLPPQPNFLSRVGVYKTPEFKIGDEVVELEDFQEVKGGDRKSKCLACSAEKVVEKIDVPEDRIPWEPSREELKDMKRKRSRSVPPRKLSERLPTIKEKPTSASSTVQKTRIKKSHSQEKQEGPSKEVHTQRNLTSISRLILNEPQSIKLSRGSLNLSINFPSDTFVKFSEKRVRGSNICSCIRNIKVH